MLVFILEQTLSPTKIKGFHLHSLGVAFSLRHVKMISFYGFQGQMQGAFPSPFVVVVILLIYNGLGCFIFFHTKFPYQSLGNVLSFL